VIALSVIDNPGGRLHSLRLYLAPLFLSFAFLSGCESILDYDYEDEYETGPYISDPGPIGAPNLNGSYQINGLVISSSFGGEISIRYSVGNGPRNEIARNVEIIAGAYRDDQKVGEVRYQLNNISPGESVNGSITIPVSKYPTSDYFRIWWDDAWGNSYYVDLDRCGITYKVDPGLKAHG
jgi:hypothetical protein